mgnify:CR=1 FL=1
MGEHSIIEIADALDSGLDIKDITFIDGTVYKTRKREDIYDAIELPHYEALLADKKKNMQKKLLCAVQQYGSVRSKTFV